MSDNKNLSYINGGKIIFQNDNEAMVHKYFKRLCIGSEDTDGITFYNSCGESAYFSYKEIAAVSYERLKKLHEIGLKAKDKLVFQCSTGKDFIEMFWACMFGGIIPVPLNLIYDYNLESQEVAMLKNILKMLEYPKTAVSSDCFADYSRMFDDIGIERNLLIEIEEIKNTEEFFEDMIPEENGLNSDELAIMFFTSGSTGVPKGVMQSNKAIVSREIGVAELNNFKKDISLNWMPLEHAGGVLMAHFRSIFLRSSQVIVDKEYILQEPLRWLDLMSEYKVVYSWAPHFAFELINKEIENGRTGNWDLSSVEFLLNGGEMINCAGAKKFLKLLKPYGLCDNAVHPSWGMCETCSGVMYNNELDSSDYSGIKVIKKSSGINVIFGNLEDDDVRSIMSIGKPVPSIEIRITDSHDNILLTDTIGRFQIKGAPVTMGYFKNDEVNAESFTDDGWFITGDLGFIHDGNMILTGREKDTIIINGLNYNNAEIEAVIENLPYVEKSFTAVCAVNKNNDTKDNIAAFFVAKEGKDPYFIRKNVIEIVKNQMHLALDEVIMVFKDDIPKSNLEKIQRKKIANAFSNGDFDSTIDNINEYTLLNKEHKLPKWFLSQTFRECEGCIEEESINNICVIGDIPDKFVDALRNMINNVRIYSDVPKTEKETFDAILYLGDFDGIRLLGKKIASGEINSKKLYVVTKLLYKVLDSDECNYKNAAIAGFLKCLDAEMENTSVCNIDIQSFENDCYNIIKEINSKINYIQIAYRNNIRYNIKLTYPVNNNTGNGFGYGELYLITGGMGGIGSCIAEFLLKYYNASVILIGRSNISDSSEKINKFNKLKDISESVYYETADVSDKIEINAVVEKYEKITGKRISKIIHTAGLGNLTEHWTHFDERMIKNCEESLYEEMFEAKINGTQNLYSIAEERENTQLVLCGSTNSFFGSATFSAYSSANSYVDYFAQAVNKPEKVICLNFSTWSDLGMSKNNPFESMGIKKGFYEMDSISGVLSIAKAVQFDESSVFIGLDISNEYIRNYLSDDIVSEMDCNEKINVNTDNYNFNSQEMILADIWRKILGNDKISVNDDFFELGGNSLKAMKLLQEIRNAYSINYTLRQVFQYSAFSDMMKSILESSQKI